MTDFNYASDLNLDRDIEDFFFEFPECERCHYDLRSSSEKETGICDLCMTLLRLEPRDP